ncbi:hypothetical protein AACH06_19330 [Ideonella sp. DXS29W]|uniref:MalT-like TPR region domain-containing protein n=1 Tax=Ideonella lacteola TaxID=2984193 RepID=A0ABU9BSN1_9BURK
MLPAFAEAASVVQQIPQEITHAIESDDEPSPTAPSNTSLAGFSYLVDVLSRAEGARPQRRAAARPPGEEADGDEDPIAQAMSLANEGRFSESMALCARHRPHWLATANVERLGQCDFLILRGHQSSGRARDAVEAGFRALNWFEFFDQPPTRLYTCGLLALALACVGDAPKAFEILNVGKRLLPAMEAGSLYTALFFSYSGSTLWACGQLPEAAAAFEQSLQHLDSAKEPTRHRIVMQNLLSTRLQLAFEQPDGFDHAQVHEMLVTYREYAERDRAAGHLVSLARNAQFIGDAYWQLGQLEDARVALLGGIQAAEAAKSGPDRGMLLWRLARLDRLQNNHRSASTALALSIELLEQSQQLRELAAAHLEAAALHEARLHWHAAVASLREHLRIRDRVQKSEVEARMYSLRVQLDVAQEGAAFKETLGHPRPMRNTPQS